MSTHERHTTAAEDRVPWNQLIAYGMGGLIPIALFNIAGQLMGLLGNISLGLSAFWLGTIMIVPRLWDAFSDPIIGHLSDNTRTRWGRRRPYILFGGIAVALELRRHVVGAARRVDPGQFFQPMPPTTGSSSRTSWAGCSCSLPPPRSLRFRMVRSEWRCPATTTSARACSAPKASLATCLRWERPG